MYALNSQESEEIKNHTLKIKNPNWPSRANKTLAFQQIFGSNSF